MLVGDSLYVKWRIKATGEVLQETVDLRHRLPRDIEDHRIYFVVRERKLFVYLISPERLPPGSPPNELRIFRERKVKVIYPD